MIKVGEFLVTVVKVGEELFFFMECVAWGQFLFDFSLAVRHTLYMLVELCV